MPVLTVISRAEFKRHTHGRDHVVGPPIDGIEIEDLIDAIVSPVHLESHVINNVKWPISYLAIYSQEASAWFLTAFSYDQFLEKALMFEIERCYRLTLW